MRDTGMGLVLGYSRLGREHAVEGEVRTTSVHPDDDAAQPRRTALDIEDAMARRALLARAQQTEHPVEAQR